MKTFYITLLIFVSTIIFGQTIKLTDNLIYPRLDSTYWVSDFDIINKNRSSVAERCQTCIYKQTDTTRGRFCFNTALGHVQMDTMLYNFPAEKLIGEWSVINFGLFITTDSILSDSKIVYRNQKILNEQTKDNGKITFTDKRAKFELKNNKEIPNRNRKYKIINGKFLSTRFIYGYCGATNVGMTKDGYLILDDITFRTLAKKEKYLVVKTSIRRLILKRSTSA